MDNFSNSEPRRAQDYTGVNHFLARMYGLMALAVLVSAVTAYFTSLNMAAVVGTLANHSWVLWLLLIVPFGLVMGVGFKADRNPAASLIMLLLTAVIYGFFFALIALAYTQTTLTTAFVSSAMVFVAMALVGTFTKRDLSNLGSYAFAALIGLIVALIINLFLRNPMVNLVFSVIGVIIFTILSATDANKMKQLYLNYHGQIATKSLVLVGALQLYLDFINIFLFLLQILGGGGDRN